MNIKKYFFSICLLLFFTNNSCEIFSTSKVSIDDIKKASSWSKNDQMPNFPECESLTKKKEQLECFQNIISGELIRLISEDSVTAKLPFKSEIFLKLMIDKEGYFSLLNADISGKIESAFPELYSVLSNAVNNLPKALPATKTNVGVFVNSQFTLPIQISAQ